MKRLTHFLKSLLHPSVDETLNTFQTKINQLDTRIDLIADEVNLSDATINAILARKRTLSLDMAKAEKAREMLTEIVGSGV